MLVAKQKRKDNIAEYILYMWQVEDTIRACKFNIDVIEERIISQFTTSNQVKAEARDWYANLIVMMHEEDRKSIGHLSMLESLVDDLYDLHTRILSSGRDQKYADQYALTAANIKEFENKLGASSRNEIETCLTALYALLLLRLRKKNITRETLEAMQTFSNLLAMLAKWYKKIEEGTAEL